MTFPWPVAALPRPHRAERQRTCRERWRERNPGDSRPAIVREMEADAAGTALLDSLFGNSPFLSELVLSDPDFTALLWRDGPDAAFAITIAGIDAAGRDTA